MRSRLTAGLTPRDTVLLLTVLAVLLLLPHLIGGYVLSVVIIILYFSYVGQAWNLAMGFAGQLSLGHVLYVGLGAYTSAALFVHFNVPPLIGLFASIAVAMCAAALIGALAFRYGIGGVYFALLTIAFAEFTRLLFSHFEWVGATAGFFLPVENRTTSDLVNLRGSPIMFYYVILCLSVGALIGMRILMTSRMGYYLLAIREDQAAAQSLGINIFRHKMQAVMLSAAMTSLGGVFLAFYYNNLFPSDAFGMHRSIEIILAPIIGGLGTFFGPIVGAVLLGVMGESLTAIVEASGAHTAGIKQVVYALVLLCVVKFLPGGVWPWIASRWRKANGETRP